MHGGLFSARSAELVRSARVPVIRVARSRIPGSDREVKVDITMGVSSGARAVAFVQRQVQAMPPLRPLVLVLKALLKQHGLNEPRLGGLSSYCLLNMVRRGPPALCRSSHFPLPRGLCSATPHLVGRQQLLLVSMA